MTSLHDTPDGRTLHDLLAAMEDTEASDLHLVAGYRPIYRIHGRLRPGAGGPLSPEQTAAMIDAVLPTPLPEAGGGACDRDFSVAFEHAGRTMRFRVNVFAHQGLPGAC